MNISHTIRLVTSAAGAIAEVQKYQGSLVGCAQTVEKHANTLSGGKLLKSANEWTASIAKLGGASDTLATAEQLLAGASKLTGNEKARVNSIITEAIEKYRVLGQTAPAAMVALEKATRAVETPTTGLTTRMVAMGTAIGTFLGRMAYDGVKALATGIADIAARGVGLAPVVTSFEKLTAAAGLSGDTLLRVARQDTKGLISNLDLMASANKALLLGLPLTESSFGQLARTATVLGRAMKLDAARSVDDLITALGRSSSQVLDNLGLTVEAGDANTVYARQIGKTAEQLTDAEKKLAFYNATMAAAKIEVAELGGIQLTMKDRVNQGKVAFTNFTDALGVAIARSPVINTALDSIASGMSAAFGTNQTVVVQQLIGKVNTFATTTVSLAQGVVTVAQYVVRGWSAIDMIVTQTMLGFMTVSEGISKGFLGVVSAAAAISNMVPGMRGRYDGLRETIQAVTWQNEGMRKSFQEQSAEAWEGVKGNSAVSQSLTAMGASLETMKAQMITASQTQASAASIAADLAGNLGKTGQSATTAGPALKKYADDVKDLVSRLDNVNAKGTPAAETIERLGKEALKAQERAEELGQSYQALPPSIGKAALAYLTLAANQKIAADDAKLLGETIGKNAEAAKAWADERSRYDAAILAKARATVTAVLALNETEYQSKMRAAAQWRDERLRDLEVLATKERYAYAGSTALILAEYAKRTAAAKKAMEESWGGASLGSGMGMIPNVKILVDLITQYGKKSGSGFLAAFSASVSNIGSVIVGALQGGGNVLYSVLGGLASDLGSYFTARFAEQLKNKVITGFEAAFGSSVVTASIGFVSKILSDILAPAFTGFEQLSREFGLSVDEVKAKLQSMGEAGRAAFEQMESGAEGVFGSISKIKGLAAGKELFGMAGQFSTRAELVAIAQQWESTYDYMLKSGLYTAQALADAWKQYQAALEAAAGTVPAEDTRPVGARGFPTRAELQQAAADAEAAYKYIRDSGLYTASVVDDAFQAWQDSLAAAGNAGAAAMKKMDAEIASLQESVGREEVEAVMGDIEKAERARLEALKAEKAAALVSIEEQRTAAEAASDAAQTSVIREFDTTVKKAKQLDDELTRIFSAGYTIPIRFSMPALPGGSNGGGSEYRSTSSSASDDEVVPNWARAAISRAPATTYSPTGDTGGVLTINVNNPQVRSDRDIRELVRTIYQQIPRHHALVGRKGRG